MPHVPSLAEILGVSGKEYAFVNTRPGIAQQRFIDPTRLSKTLTSDGTSYSDIVESFLRALPDFVYDIDTAYGIKETTCGIDAPVEIEIDTTGYRSCMPCAEAVHTDFGYGKSKGAKGKGLGFKGLGLLASLVEHHHPDEETPRLSHLIVLASFHGISHDKVSDLLTNILCFALSEFTLLEAQKLGVDCRIGLAQLHGWDWQMTPSRYLEKRCHAVMLPDDPTSCRLLVPKSIVSDESQLWTWDYKVRSGAKRIVNRLNKLDGTTTDTNTNTNTPQWTVSSLARRLGVGVRDVQKYCRSASIPRACSYREWTIPSPSVADQIFAHFSSNRPT